MVKTSDSGLYFQIYCAGKRNLQYILMVLWITVCAFGRGLQSKNFLPCLSGGWNAGELGLTLRRPF